MLEDSATRRYRKLVIDKDGPIAGAILLGAAGDIAPAIRSAIGNDVDVSRIIPELREGEWDALSRAQAMART